MGIVSKYTTVEYIGNCLWLYIEEEAKFVLKEAGRSYFFLLAVQLIGTHIFARGAHFILSVQGY